MMKTMKYVWLLLMLAGFSTLCAQPRQLTLDSCRALALQSNTNLKISAEQQGESEALR